MKGRLVREAELECRLLDRQPLIDQIALCSARERLFDDFRKRSAFFQQPAAQ